MHSDELREKYLTFFESKGHTRCPSDVLVPKGDPSVLFTPAGMNQFKDHFLGKVKLDFTRATTCQKCLRTGDIDNVGRTAYHHTFFEMLGNFSFGDYFKREAIVWAWEFLTDPKWLGLPADRLTVSVYLDDDEAAEIWQRDVKLSPERIQRMGEDDNFWPAGAPTQGPDGVCGPCSEIFYHDPQFGEVEIWNLVFTQFNRVGDPPDNLRPLPSKNIDTGMGFERTAAVLQGQSTNFHIDILKPIVEAAAEICELSYDPTSEHGRRLRRITDHVRACTFAIHENVYPGPHKEKYVVRRLLRRAVLDGHQLGLRDPFLHQLVPVVVEMMRRPYPELGESVERVAQAVRQEEAAFFGTIDAGLARIDAIFREMESGNQPIVRGQQAAELYQTYGVPPELVESMAVEQGLTFDWEGFREAMADHGVKSGGGTIELFKTGPVEALKRALQVTQFVGYETTEAEAEVKGIVQLPGDAERAEGNAGQLAQECGATDSDLLVVLDCTPFYGESGGQLGDVGQLVGEGLVFDVLDTQKDGDLILHRGRLKSGTLRVGARVEARVDAPRRQGIRRAHSATHMVHHALQKHLGSHAQQQGSKVDQDWLRFDFTNLEPVSAETMDAVEADVRQLVGQAAPISWQTVPLAEARQRGAMMLFGEKYPDPVRMVSMGEFSKELCGGTHLQNTSEVGDFEVISEEGVSAGTRRLVALTGAKAREHAARTTQVVEAAAGLLQTSPAGLVEAARALMAQVRERKKQLASGQPSSDQPTGTSGGGSAPAGELTYQQLRNCLRDTARLLNVSAFDVPARIEALQAELASLGLQVEQLLARGQVSAEQLLEAAQQVGGAKLVACEVPGANPNLMRQWIDQLRKKAAPIAVLLVAADADGKVVLVAGVSRELVEAGFKAGDWVREVAPVVGGGGGGKPDMAQAGGKDPAKIPAAIETAVAFATARLTAS